MKHFALCLAVVLASLAFGSDVAQAQASGSSAAASGTGKASTTKRTPKAKRAKVSKQKQKSPVRSAANDKPAEKPEGKPAAAEPASPTGAAHVPAASEDAAALAVDADERVRKEGGSEVKTMEFGGLELDGQLKTPQMLYFLNRLRAEFSRPELPHRSFMPELQRGTRENGF